MSIVSYNKGGLSNRIKSLVSCLRYNDEKEINYNKVNQNLGMSTKCYLEWPVLNKSSNETHLLNCNSNILFKEIDYVILSNLDEKDKNVILNDINIKKYNSHCLMVLEDDNLPNNFNNFNSKCSVKFSINDKLNRNIDNMYLKIPKNVIEAYLPYFQKIQLIDELNNKVDRFAGLYFNERTVSVHIRSWNRNGEKGRRKFLFNIKKFEKEIVSRILENQLLGYHMINFFMATDSQEVRDYFTNKFSHKDKILLYPRTTNLDTSRDFPEGIQEDAVELFLLSKNKYLIGSHFSSYSEVAWWLGGCTDKVVIV